LITFVAVVVAVGGVIFMVRIRRRQLMLAEQKEIEPAVAV